MKISDLKAGEHIVELRDGDRYIVLKSPNGLFLSGVEDVFSSLGCYGELMDCRSDNNLDICKVYDIVNEHNLDNFTSFYSDRFPIWQREEKTILRKEIEDLQMLASTLSSKLEDMNKNLKGFSGN